MSLPRFRKLITRIYSNQGLAVLVVIFLFSLVLFFSQVEKDPQNLSDRVSSVQAEISNPEKTNDESLVQNKAMSGSDPVRLLIPKIDIDTTFEAPLGLFPSGEVEVPDTYTKVGWYKYGPTPGELGPAVILGHVDSYQGPAVFFYLGQLAEGDDIYIERSDGETAHFKVTKLERYEQVEFPAAKVYGDIDHAGLRLITCSGIFNRGNQRYSHNLVVYAKLVE